MRGFSVALVASLLTAGPVLAASPMGQLRDIDGKVYVNRGEGFVPAQGSIELFQGDRVMVGESGSASIKYYLAECDVMLTASSMTTVPAKAPCKGGSTASSEGLIVEGSSSIGPVIMGLGATGMLGLGITEAVEDDQRDVGQSP